MISLRQTLLILLLATTVSLTRASSGKRPANAEGAVPRETVDHTHHARRLAHASSPAPPGPAQAFLEALHDQQDDLSVPALEQTLGWLQAGAARAVQDVLAARLPVPVQTAAGGRFELRVRDGADAIARAKAQLQETQGSPTRLQRLFVLPEATEPAAKKRRVDASAGAGAAPLPAGWTMRMATQADVAKNSDLTWLQDAYFWELPTGWRKLDSKTLLDSTLLEDAVRTKLEALKLQPTDEVYFYQKGGQGTEVSAVQIEQPAGAHGTKAPNGQVTRPEAHDEQAEPRELADTEELPKREGAPAELLLMVDNEEEEDSDEDELPAGWTERDATAADVLANADLTEGETAYFHADEAPDGQEEHPNRWTLPAGWTQRAATTDDVTANVDLTLLRTAYFHDEHAPDGQEEHPNEEDEEEVESDYEVDQYGQRIWGYMK